MTRLHHAALAAAFAMTFAVLAPRADAGPGAHGPNGEHLDGAATGPAIVDASPRLEAATELFELVARLEGERLSIFVDAFATNEPVVGADLTVEAGELQAKAKFDPVRGDYVVDEPRFVAALAAPGEHSLVFTLVAGDESDLLEGRLVHAGDAHEHDHVLGLDSLEWLGVLALLAALGGGAWYVWRRGGVRPLRAGEAT